MRAFGVFLLVFLANAGRVDADSLGRFPGKGNQTDWNNASKISLQGGSLAAKGKHSEAMQLFKQAQKIYPFDATFPYNFANSAAKLGQVSDAESSYKQAIELEPNYYSAWYNLGYLYSNANKFDQAKKAYLKALTLKPQSADALYEYAVVLEKEGKLSEASGYFARAKACASSDADKQQIEICIKRVSAKTKTASDH